MSNHKSKNPFKKSWEEILIPIFLIGVAFYLPVLFEEYHYIAYISMSLIVITTFSYYIGVPKRLKDRVKKVEIERKIDSLYNDFIKNICVDFARLIDDSEPSSLHQLSTSLINNKQRIIKFQKKLNILQQWHNFFWTPEKLVKGVRVSYLNRRIPSNQKEFHYLTMEFIHIVKYYEQFVEEFKNFEKKKIEGELKKDYLRFKENHNKWVNEFERFINKVNIELAESSLYIDYKGSPLSESI